MADADATTSTGAARMLSTDHPGGFYAAAGVELLIMLGVGIWFMTKSVGAGIAMILIGLAAAAFTAWPGWWSARHPEQAHHRVSVTRDQRNALARKHPAYFLIVIPLVGAADAALRYHRNNHDSSALSWVIPAAAGLVFGLIVGAVIIYKAHHASMPGGAPMTGSPTSGAL